MRAASVLAAGLTVVFAVGCISVVRPASTPTVGPEPTPHESLTQPPTEPPTQPPTEPPTAQPTAAPTAAPTPDSTPDPNASPTATSLDLAPYLTAEVTAVNLAAQPLTVTVTLVDTESTDEFEIGTFELAPEQVTAQAIVPTRFRLDFALNGTEVATCTIDIADGEQLQFAVIEAGVVMTSNGAEPEDPAEMVVATASRCQAGAVQ